MIRYYDLGLERSVLQIILFDFQSLVKLSVRSQLRPELFSDLSYRRIFRAINSVYGNGQRVPNEKLVKRRLIRSIKSTKTREKVLAVMERFREPKEDDLRNSDAYVEELHNLETGRKLQFLVKGTIKYLDEGNVGAALGEIMKTTSTPDDGIPVEESDFLDIFLEAVETDKMKKQYPELFRRFPTGIYGIDSRTSDEISLDSIMSGGLVRGSIFLIVGSTGIGKSHLLNEANVNGIKAGNSTVFVTNEMLLADAQYRALSTLTGIPFVRFQNGKLTSRDYVRIKKREKYYKGRSVTAKFISYPEVSTAGALRAKLLQWKQEGFVAEEVVLDYLNEMTPSDVSMRGRDGRDWQAMGSIMSELRALSLSWDSEIQLKSGQKIYGMPIIVANQGKTSMAGKVSVKTEDAAFSPIPPQIAAGVGFLAADETMKEQNILDFVLTKWRFGKTGRLRLYPNFRISRLHSKRRAKRIMLDDSFDLGEEER